MIIVTGVDASPAALKVVERAVAHARKWEADLHVLHVYQPPAALYAVDTGFALHADEIAEAEREAVWGGLVPYLDSSGVTWSRHDLQGHPASLLTSHAESVGAGLIVVGSRGRGDLASLILGSTSRGVIHEAACDVLIVRIGDEGQA